MTELRTYTGLHLNLLSPQPDQICIEDLAHHLSLECRWGGACSRHYSVAEHSIYVSRWAKKILPGAELWAMLHDAHEAYIKDVQGPLKKFLGSPVYKALTQKLDVAILQHFNIPAPSEEVRSAVHLADQYCLFIEARALTKGYDVGIEPPEEMTKNLDMFYAIKGHRSPTLIETSYKTYLLHLIRSSK